MRTIKQLYKVKGTTLSELSMDAVRPVDLITYNTGINGTHNSTVMAVVTDMDSDEDIFVDLLGMITLTELINDAQIKLATCDERWSPGDALPDPSKLDWKIVGECITDKLVMGFCHDFPRFDNGKKSIRFAQVIHHEDFEFSYCLIQTPEDRNTKFRRWQLLDAAITKVNKKNPIQLENCLLSVNGLLSIPQMFKGELLMPRGAEFMHNNDMDNLPNVTLIDFTNLGGIEIVPFSKCVYRVRSGRKITGSTPINTPITPGHEIEIQLPDGSDLVDKHVWMVLGHSLYFSEYLRIISNNSITIAPHLLSLGSMLLKQRYHSFKYNFETETFSTEDEVNTYINKTAWDPEHFGAFFVLIKTPNMYIRTTPAQQYARDRMFTAIPNTAGLLWDKTSHSFYDHTVMHYRSITDFYSMPPRKIHRLTVHEPFGINDGCENIHPYFHQFMQQYHPDMEVMEVISA